MDSGPDERNHQVITALLKAAGKGSVAGFSATAPMTAFMLAMHRALPRRQRHSLPPRKLTMYVAARMGLKQHMDERKREGATLASHFAYGAAAGAGYGLLASRIHVNPLIKGTAYGLAVWTGSYLGLIPALDMPEAATDETLQRNMLMVGAHIVWGSAVGAVMNALTRQAG